MGVGGLRIRLEPDSQRAGCRLRIREKKSVLRLFRAPTLLMMSVPTDLLLAVWREASRSIRMEELVTHLFPQLQLHLPLASLLVRRFDAAHRIVETIASSDSSHLENLHRGMLEQADWQRLTAAMQRQTFCHGSAEQLESRLPGLLPQGLTGDVLIVGLSHGAAATGAAILLPLNAIGFDGKGESIMAALAEPLSVALQNDQRLRDLSALREAAEADRQSLLLRLKRQDIADTVIGAEAGLREVMERVDLVARSDAPVLILGETGTGKEVVARSVHRRSLRRSGPFIRVNCGAVPPDLIDSELFGHEKGSFTGAVGQRKGWFERADGGTLFMDEIGELTPAVQVRLLRVLQDGSFQRVGGQQTLSVNVRVIAATNRDLYAAVNGGTFREDLWYRIAVFPIRLPALRERVSDIPSLANHFALTAAERLGLTPRLPTPADLALLAAYHWPGNVRELASVLERAAILGNGVQLQMAQALGPTEPQRQQGDAETAVRAEPAAFENLDAVNKRHIEAALTRALGRIEGPFGAATLLNINPHTLRARMRKLGIDWKRFRRP